MAYTVAMAIKYLAMAVSTMTLLMLIAGYFGCKLQSLEAAAVVQVSTLLLMTLKDTGPTFAALSDLSYSLGIIVLVKDDYYYEDSEIPNHYSTLISDSNLNNLVNIFFVVVIVPLLTSIVLKILSKTIFKGSYPV